MDEGKVKRSRKRKLISLISLLGFVLFLALGLIFIGKPLMNIVSDPQKFREWASSEPLSRLIFILMTIVQIVIAVIPGELFEIAAGCAFGAFEGTLLSLVGVALGSALTFFLSKKFGTKIIDGFYPIEKINQFRFLKNVVGLRITYLVLMLIPGTPKDLLTYCFGLTRLGWIDYLFISVIGRIPSIYTSALAGDQYAKGNLWTAAAILAITFVTAFIGAFFYRRYLKKKNAKNTENTTDN